MVRFLTVVSNLMLVSGGIFFGDCPDKQEQPAYTEGDVNFNVGKWYVNHVPSNPFITTAFPSACLYVEIKATEDPNKRKEWISFWFPWTFQYMGISLFKECSVATGICTCTLEGETEGGMSDDCRLTNLFADTTTAPNFMMFSVCEPDNFLGLWDWPWLSQDYYFTFSNDQRVDYYLNDRMAKGAKEVPEPSGGGWGEQWMHTVDHLLPPSDW